MGPNFRRSLDEPQSSSENGGSGDDSRATALSPKKGKRSVKKKVVTVPTGGEAEGSGRSGGGCPPSDSWAWRKYGQKPIKGSPYPRAYYRCSSSKGCPARKQVERSRDDPTLLIITYACDHNHSVPTSKHHHSSPATVVPATPPSPVTPPAAPQITADDDVDAFVSEDQEDIFAYAVELGLVGDALMSFSWLPDVAMGGPSFVGPRWDDADMAVNLSMREEDESLFADLDELPECSAVFRRGRGNSTCKLRASLCGGGT